MYKRIFLPIMLMILIILSSIPVHSFKANIVVIIKLSDGAPLPHALVRITSSPYSGKFVYENYTNEKGITVFKEVYVGDLVRNVKIEVYYSFYGLIYEDRESIENENETLELVLPYQIFKTVLKVIDEYGNPVDGSYKLYYSGEYVFGNSFKNGIITINGTINNKYLLRGEDISYKLVVSTHNSTQEVIIENAIHDAIVIDTHKPIVMLNKINTKYHPLLRMWWINVAFNVTDGLNTEKVSVYLTSYSLPNREHYYHSKLSPVLQVNNWQVYNVTYHVYTSRDTAVLINITAMDITGKITLVEEVRELIRENTITGHDTTTRTKTSINSNNTIVHTTGSTTPATQPMTNINTNISSWYIPGGKKEDNQLASLLLYSSGIVIAIVILIVELRKKSIK